MRVKLAHILFILISCISISTAQTITNEFYRVSAGNGNGIKFWSNTDYYKIHMGNTTNNKYGPVTDYSIKMNMTNSSGRGWVWGPYNGKPVAALNTVGNYQVKGWLKSESRFIYLGNDQRFYGDGNSAIYVDTNHSTVTQILLRDKERKVYGRLYGAGDGAFFGLRDGDNNWSYLASKDNYTQFRINNVAIMTLDDNGQIDLPSTRDASGAAGSGVLEIGNALRLDNNEIITNTNSTLYLNHDNNGDLAVDNTTLRVDASSNRIGIGFTAPQTKLEAKGVVRATSSTTRNNHTEIGHGGSHGYINTSGVGNLDFRHHGSTLMSLHDNGTLVLGNVTTPSSDYKLYVEKGILSEKVRVAVKNTSEWADFVFDNTYKLMSLSDVNDFIGENNHLPGVPSAEEVVKDGIDMAKMDAILLQKLEEAYLYIIQLKAEVTEINNKLKSLNN